ncbi:MAG: Os1348 family NHLP clan protein [Candidatus Limnocylindria bacterium]
MSKEALAKVVQRAISDAGFRRQLSSDPAGALRGFELTGDEMSAIRTGDAGRLSTLGIDQRMSKAFALGGAVGATRMAASDLNAGNAAMIDDGTGAGGTIIPHDPESSLTADDDGGASTRSAIRDDPDGLLAVHANRVSGGTASVRTGDDWKFTDRVAAEGSVAPIEGSPEATAAELKANTAGIGSLDDATRDAPTPIRDDPDGFLAAQAAKADASSGSAGETAFIDDSEGYLTSIGYDSTGAGSVVTDAHDRGDVVRIADDDAGGSNAGSENGPNIDS